MRHRVASKKLNRSTGHRVALFKNLTKALILHGEITTTETKAKVIRPIAEKLITRAKKQNLAARKMIQAYFNNGRVTSYLMDQVAPQMNTRDSGYTRITRVGPRRGDDTMMATISLVDRIVPVEVPEKKTATKTKKDTKK